MIIYCHKITPRLRYISDFIGREISNEPFQLTSDIELFRNYTGFKINYNNQRISENEFYLSPHSLLFEKNIQQQQTNCFVINGQKAFFKTEGDFPFDIFAASFYLLSRYEEYLPHKKDMYSRYAHENSLAYKENFLHLPLINLWLEGFKNRLKQKSPQFLSALSGTQFQFLPTYDIDEAFCYKQKNWWRTYGGYLRSVLKGQWSEVKERQRVLNGEQDDPYDSFDWIKHLHNHYNYLNAYGFFLVAGKTGRYDKNSSPLLKPVQELILNFIEQDTTTTQHSQHRFLAGIHPSWQSGNIPSLLKEEMDTLQNKIGVEIRGSRQHFIRFSLPQTFRQLINAGIFNDYSMGYGSINGFRASVASSFDWYDLEKEEKTNLHLHPFCYMDANSFFEQKHTPQQALEEMLHYFSIIKSVNGTMITIWHNTFLGTHKRFAGWREVYEEFIREIYYQIPYVNNQIDSEGMDKKYFLH